MYRIGEFSKLGKVSIKTLRFYEKEKLLFPSYVDQTSGYRFYETNQLVDLCKIIALRQIGLSINDIKDILAGQDMKEILISRKNVLENEISISNDQLSRINNILIKEESIIMNDEVIIKELPDYTVYYKKGVIADYSYITEFILKSAEECLAVNPGLKCIEPEYCYMCYLDGEYKDKDISIEYAQAVEHAGVETETIKFKKLEKVNAASIYHRGDYKQIGKSYGKILKWIESNGYGVADFPRERYIDGIWNKENPEDWLTEIQFPIKKK